MGSTGKGIVTSTAVYNQTARLDAQLREGLITSEQRDAAMAVLNTSRKVGESLNERLENIRAASETRRIVEEANRQQTAGVRNWVPTANQRISNVSYDRARLELFNAPVGTVITMDNHNTGDYVGEYTRTAAGWTGSQQYSSNRRAPANVSTAEGFAMQITGNDIRVLKVGRRKHR